MFRNPFGEFAGGYWGLKGQESVSYGRKKVGSEILFLKIKITEQASTAQAPCLHLLWIPLFRLATKARITPRRSTAWKITIAGIFLEISFCTCRSCQKKKDDAKMH